TKVVGAEDVVVAPTAQGRMLMLVVPAAPPPPTSCAVGAVSKVMLATLLVPTTPPPRLVPRKKATPPLARTKLPADRVWLRPLLAAMDTSELPPVLPEPLTPPAPSMVSAPEMARSLLALALRWVFFRVSASSVAVLVAEPALRLMLPPPCRIR